MASWFWTVPVCSFAILASSCLTDCAARAGLPSYSSVPAFNLTDQSGEPFESRAKLDGNVWIADFFFTTCPGPCPRMSSQMHQVETALAKFPNVRLVSFTVDPAHDTPLVLDAYAKHFGAEAGRWFFLTGSQPTLQHLCRDVFMLGNVDGSLQHSTRFVLIDRDSKVRGYYETSEPDAITRIIADAKKLAAS